jgi:hypothetical protein
MEVIGTSNFRKVSIGILAFKSGSDLQWLELTRFAKYLFSTIQLPIRFEALSGPCLIGANLEELR